MFHRIPLRPIVALVLAGIAILIWSRQVWHKDSVTDLAALYNTTGIEVTVLDSRSEPHGFQVRCRLVNYSSRTAVQVVFEVDILTPDGRTLASNPLAGASHLTPGETREINVAIPMPGSPRPPNRIPPRPQATAIVTLVRWSP